MTRRLNNPFSNFYAKQAQITNYHSDFLLGVAPSLTSALVLTTNLYMQSPGESSSREKLIPEEISRCFYKMDLRRSVSRIPCCLMRNSHGPEKALLIFLLTIIWSIHLCSDCPQICWRRFLQSDETACTCVEARSLGIFRP
jgi:hypothetical protein